LNPFAGLQQCRKNKAKSGKSIKHYIAATTKVD